MAAEGDRPGGAPNSGSKPTDSPPRQFADFTPAEQIRVVEILKPGFERALARHLERKRIEAAGLTRAA